MAFSEHRDAGNTAFAAEFMDMYVQHRCVRRFGGLAQRFRHEFGIVKPRTAPEIDEQMGAGIGLAVFVDEKIPRIVCRSRMYVRVGAC